MLNHDDDNDKGCVRKTHKVDLETSKSAIYAKIENCLTRFLQIVNLGFSFHFGINLDLKFTFNIFGAKKYVKKIRFVYKLG